MKNYVFKKVLELMYPFIRVLQNNERKNQSSEWNYDIRFISQNLNSMLILIMPKNILNCP